MSNKNILLIEWELNEAACYKQNGK